jgi:hypothetical protein
MDVRLLGQVGPVVDDHVRGQFAHGRQQLLGPPVDPPLAAPDAIRVGEIEPEDVDRTVAGQQFADLSVEISRILGDVAAGVGGDERFVVAARMETIDREVGVVPVDQGMVKPDA